jgi:hypothetical protein
MGQTATLHNIGFSIFIVTIPTLAEQLIRVKINAAQHLSSEQPNNGAEAYLRHRK